MCSFRIVSWTDNGATTGNTFVLDVEGNIRVNDAEPSQRILD
jgi:hypothetical protein